eukprot:TRINITY_DN5144_c0_g3_i2.p1 TRINITY_DN5144_c0_g3~~TRINITY_DN5144_c0_g3_i2.p1  ORF type:complete len:115 (+),score=11.11 TRINITY_DN5144_c0_g3_i2:176-520(+)
MALKAHGIEFHRLPRSLSDSRTGDMLRDFQEKTEPRVLLLSLERAAAGTNLTAASHVLFVHPMNAESAAAATAYEKQAIGRVRRLGQKRQTIHVHRFISKDTVEEHINKLHRES